MIENPAQRQRVDLTGDKPPAEAEAAAAPASADSEAAVAGQPIRIGVLFVHGIGKQSQSETVREFAEPIYDWVTRWLRARHGLLQIEKVELSYGNPLGGTPARYELRIPPVDQHPEQTWVLAEGFWADRLTPPSLPTMVGWGFHTLGPVLLTLAGNTISEPWRRRKWFWEELERQNAPRSRYALLNLGTFVDLISQWLLLVAYLLGLVLGTLLLIVLYPFALIPIPQLKDFILVRVLAPILTEWIGDFHVYTHDPLMSQHMRNGVSRAAAWLAGPGECQSVCVIGHSGGGLVGFDAVMNAEIADVGTVRKLITMGSALNQASAQERARRSNLETRWPNATPEPERFQGNTQVARGRRKVDWVDISAAYDPVAMGLYFGPKPRPDMDVEATNEMNLLTDHGGYFRNDEEVISLLAQEISTPEKTPADSRFYLKEPKARMLRRWERVITLVGWRLTGIFLFVLVALGRRDRLPDDGRRVWAALAQLPGLDGVAAIVRGVFDLLSASVGGLAEAAPIGGLSVVLRFLREFLRPAGLEPIVSMSIAAALVGALLIFVYWGLTFGLYEPWRRDERAHSVDEDLPARTTGQRVLIWLRAIAVPTVLIAYGYFVFAL